MRVQRAVPPNTRKDATTGRGQDESDAAGNRTRIAVDDSRASDLADSVTECRYNALIRFTKAPRSGTPDDDSDLVGDGDFTVTYVTYGFDGVGNRTAMTKILHDPPAFTKVTTYGL